MRFREVLSSLHDILRGDDAAARRLQRRARENASLTAFMDDVAASLEDPDKELDASARIDAVVLPLTLIRNTSKEGLLDLITWLKLSREEEDPQAIVEHHLHNLQTEAAHRTPYNERHPRAASDSGRSESELNWDPLLRRRDHYEVPNLPSEDEVATEVSSRLSLWFIRISLPLWLCLI